MAPETIATAVATVTATYGPGEVQVAADAGKTLVRIPSVELYEGCLPPTTPMMLVLDPAQPKPQVYVQVGQRLANGKEPKSTTAVVVGGESWLQFSFNIPWEEAHGITRFIAAARQRFAQHE